MATLIIDIPDLSDRAALTLLAPMQETWQENPLLPNGVSVVSLMAVAHEHTSHCTANTCCLAQHAAVKS